MTKNIQTIIAPTSQGYQGNSNDIVPGAKIIYQLVVKNSGNTSANQLVIEQDIPANTSYLQGSMDYTGSSSASYFVNSGSGFVADSGTTTNSFIYTVRWNINEIGPSGNNQNLATVNFTVVID